MEETQIIQSINILLYSRTLDTIYLEFYDSQTKILINKVYANTSAHTWLNLGMMFGSVEVMVKKNQENMQILAEFRLSQGSESGIVENMGHYVKIKKRFGNFQLLFQIQFKPKSSLNSVQSLLPTNPDLPNSTTQTNLRLSQQQQKSCYLNQLKQLAQSNLTLLTAKATSVFLNSLNKKKISLPSQQFNSRPFRKRKDKKTFTYNARINKLKKEQSKKTYMTPGGIKYKNRARSEKEVSGMTEKVLEDDLAEDSMIASKRDENPNTFILRKPRKLLEVYNNDEMSSSQATKQSFTRKTKSKNKITFLDTSLSIGTNCEQLPPEAALKKYCSQNQPIIQEKPNKFSHSIHQKIMQESCENHGETKEMLSVRNDEKSGLFNQKNIRGREIQMRTQNLYEKLRVLCGKGSSRVREYSSGQRKSGRVDVCHSQDVYTQPHQINFIKRCSNLTRPSQQPLNSINSRNSKFKQNFYEDLYLRTLESIQNQTQILQYVKAQCNTLASVSIKRQRLQYPTVQRATVERGKQNINFKKNAYVMTRQRKMELKRKKKVEEGYLAKVQQISAPIKYLKF